jgi:hypothetical protein
VLEDGGTALEDPQASAFEPLALHATCAALILHHRRIAGLEEVLPAHVESGREVSHVEQSQALEPLADIRGERFVEPAAIHDRRGAALHGGLYAEEPLFERPAWQV